MTKALHKQLVSVRFPDAKEERAREWTVALTSLPLHDQERLVLIDNSIQE